MKTFEFLLGFYILIFSSLSIAQSSGWETDANIKIKAKSLGFDSNIWFIGERRDRWNKENEHYYQHWQGTFGNSAFNKHLAYGLGYRYIESNKKIEHRPFIFFTPQTKFENIKISLRSKLEYRSREQKQNGFRYKIKPKISYTFKINENFKIAPYFADEVAYSFTQGQWSGNKIDTGISFKVTKHMEIKPFFEYEHNIIKDKKSESRWGLKTTFIF